MNPKATLTKRESEIAPLLAWGATKKEIASRLFVSVHTVENHVRNIFEKTECRSVVEFSAWYFCTNYGISIELSPLRRTVAIFLLSVYISGDVVHSFDNFVRYRTGRRAQFVRVERPRRRRVEKDYYFMAS